MGLEKLYVDNVSTFGPVVASQLPDDLDKCSKEDKAKAKNRDFFVSVTGLKFPIWTERQNLSH